ncbi:MAG: hypothetical protein IKI45_10365 [Oscillospiraceae bacterium]|nr:hypothetical protein [Oscillospiraceae bacterium]
MRQTFQAKVIKLEHIREDGKYHSVYTLEYEDEGIRKQVTSMDEPTSTVDVGGTVEITLEDGRLVHTSIGETTRRHSMLMLFCLLLVIAFLIGCALMMYFVESNAVRIPAFIIGAAVLIMFFKN